MIVPIESLGSSCPPPLGRACDPEAKAGCVVDHYLTGKLRGRAAHGIAKFCFRTHPSGLTSAKLQFSTRCERVAVQTAVDIDRGSNQVPNTGGDDTYRRCASEFDLQFPAQKVVESDS